MKEADIILKILKNPDSDNEGVSPSIRFLLDIR